MSMKPYRNLPVGRNTPQSLPLTPEQVANSAGGFVWKVTAAQQFERFLILGSEGGNYYATEQKLTADNARNAAAYITAHPTAALATLVEISKSGRAARNTPAVFALALAAANPDQKIREMALMLMPSVCRIGTDFLHFVQFVQELRGWGRQLKREVGKWYLDKDIQDATYQCIKYANRDGMSHRDVLRLAHPQPGPTGSVFNTLFHYITTGNVVGYCGPNTGLQLIAGVEAVKAAKTADEVIALIREYRLELQMVPTEWQSNAAVMETLLPNLKPEALMRSLGRCAALGMHEPFSDVVKYTTAVLTSEELIRKYRLHPLKILNALRTYASGHGVKGKLTWQPSPKIVDALNAAFYSSFGTITSTGQNWLLGLDISGSMSSLCSGAAFSCAEGSVAMAMVTARTEPEYHIVAFNREITPLTINATDSLQAAQKKASNWTGGGTDCSAPMLYAIAKKLKVHNFVVYTDNETWAGRMHPSEALKRYRNSSGINAKLMVVSMTANPFSIADPTDSGMLDIIGFDPGVPSVMADFAR